MRAIRAALLVPAVFTIGCHKPGVTRQSSRRDSTVVATAKPRPFFSARNLRTAALHRDSKVVVLAFTDKRKGPVWMLENESDGLSLIENAPRVQMFEVKELSISPDDYYLAVISCGEGHPIVEIFRLRDILAPASARAQGGVEPMASIDPYPGGICISGWHGRTLEVQSDMPLDRLDHKTRRAAASESYPSGKDMRFQWDIETDTIVRR